jgi:hypothetical protein
MEREKIPTFVAQPKPWESYAGLVYSRQAHSIMRCSKRAGETTQIFPTLPRHLGVFAQLVRDVSRRADASNLPIRRASRCNDALLAFASSARVSSRPLSFLVIPT